MQTGFADLGIDGFGETYSVSQLTDELAEFLREAFPPLWVVGEAQRIRASRNGHLYFELVEKGRGDRIVGKLDAVIWRTDFQRLRRVLGQNGQEIAEGQQLRCQGNLDFYGPGGRLQFIVRDVDPLYTLGQLELRRRQVLAALAEAGLLDTNKGLPLADVPLRIGLVTSEESAAYHDFLASLGESGFGFQVLFVHAAMQGREAERQVASALELLAGRDLDALVLIRGGGSRSDLAAFDSRAIAEAVARCRLPVLTGLGHEIDESIADRVSHRAFKTPTMVAEFLVDRLQQAELAIEGCAEALARGGQQAIRQAREALRRNERLVPAARLRLQAATFRVDDAARTLSRVGQLQLRAKAVELEGLPQRLVDAARRSIDRQREKPEALVRHLSDLAKNRLDLHRSILEGHARLCHQLAPERLLERGYSITTDASGKMLTDPSQLTVGEGLRTRLAHGVVESRVESTTVIRPETVIRPKTVIRSKTGIPSETVRPETATRIEDLENP